MHNVLIIYTYTSYLFRFAPLKKHPYNVLMCNNIVGSDTRLI